MFCRLLLLLFALAVWPVEAARGHLGMEEMRAAVERDVASDPESPDKLLEKATLHRVDGKWDAALAALEEASRRGADRDVVEASRGMIYLEAGWPQMAILSFDRVIERRSDAEAARFGRARALVLLERWDDAAAEFSRGFAVAPEPRPENAFEWRDALVAGGHPELALAALETAIARLGAVPSLQLAAIDLALSLGLADDALRRCDSLLAQQPKNAMWLARRGEILASLQRDAEARAAFASALKLIEARPVQRRGPRMLALERQLIAALGRDEKDSPEK